MIDFPKEKDVAIELFALRMNNVSAERAIKNFTACRINDKWEVRFSKFENYRLHKKNGSVRYFSRLNGVEVWMRKMGIKRFMVLL